MKIGRNDPCPCGSGRKYKQCCLQQQTALAPAEETWRRLRRLLGEFKPKLSRFTQSAYGDGSLIDAWEQFALYDEDELLPDLDHHDMACFMSWFYYHFEPEAEETSVQDESLHEVPPARAFLQRRARDLDPMLAEYVEAALNSPFSFYAVTHCTPGQRLQLIDVLTHEAFEVREETASRALTPGDVIFASVVSVAGVCLLEGSGGLVMQPKDTIPLIDLRECMLAAKQHDGDQSPLNRQDLLEWDYELREAYLDWSAQRLDPSLPELKNTDGDPLSVQVLVYQVPSAQAAFDALKHLDPDCADGDEPREAKYDDEGSLISGMLSISRPPLQRPESDKTIITATVWLACQELRAEVNSDRRAGEIQAEIGRALGGTAVYLDTELANDMDQDLDDGLDDSPIDSLNDLDPEAQEALTQLLCRHYARWPGDALPALNGQSPREAVRTAAGRAKVEALLQQFEHHRAHSAFTGPSSEMLDGIRRDLGLL
ncbi:SEC-C metal-binding domain-containing protein [Pseudomarimonas arenosa]|nr:SEC-C metal-binding domain-containing protein [Pseudomarimonas arenosa]